MDRSDELPPAVTALVDDAAGLLGERFVGAYVVGPTALGCAEETDVVEVVVVVDGRLGPEQQQDLTALHARLATVGGWAARLDCTYADLADLRSPMTYGRRWPRVGAGGPELAASAAGNTAWGRWLLREQGVVVSGPPPRELVVEVGATALRAEALGLARARAEELEDDPSAHDDAVSQQEVVLTACRTLHTATTAGVTGSAAAARWALDHLDPGHRPVVEEALAGRLQPVSPVRALVWDVVRLAGQAALEARD